MLGFGPQRRRGDPGTDGTIPPLPIPRCLKSLAQLGTVRSVGERPRVARSDINGDFSIGGTTTFVNTNSGLTGDVTGDLTTALATIPGVTFIPKRDGRYPDVSAFGITAIRTDHPQWDWIWRERPRDGFNAGVVTSTYDPGKGGFAGIQTSLRMQGGNNLSTIDPHDVRRAVAPVDDADRVTTLNAVQPASRERHRSPDRSCSITFSMRRHFSSSAERAD